MIEIKNVATYGWEEAIRGMRNPMNSWHKADSHWDVTRKSEGGPMIEFYNLENSDYDLATHLRNAGTDHRKFMRMITVYADIIAPLYWWKEFDTYKVGTVANSCSTMHKIHAKEFDISMFSYDHLISNEPIPGCAYSPKMELEYMIRDLNALRDMYLRTKDKKWWWQMIQLLPSSYNQKRTVMMNYEVLANMYKSRKNHKLDEWRDFCSIMAKELPYSTLFMDKE